MKRLLACVALVLGTTALSGCYYESDYRYVRSQGYQGDAYYGEGPATVIEDDYYGPGYYVAPGYYGYPYGSGVSIGIGGVWRSGSHHHGRDYRRDRDDRYRPQRNHAREWRRPAPERRSHEWRELHHGH